MYFLSAQPCSDMNLSDEKSHEENTTESREEAETSKKALPTFDNKTGKLLFDIKMM